MRHFLKNNGLSVVFFLHFFLSLIMQVFTGLKEYNEQRKEEGLDGKLG